MLKNNLGIFITGELSYLNILLCADDITLFADCVKSVYFCSFPFGTW